MVTRKLNVRRTNASAPVAANEAAHKIFLAGLGAVSLAHKQGEKLVTTLIEEGEDFRARTIKLTNAVKRDLRRVVSGAEVRVKRAIAPVRARAEQVVSDVETGIGERLGALLGRFGVPTKGDVDELIARVAELNRQVRASTRNGARA